MAWSKIISQGYKAVQNYVKRGAKTTEKTNQTVKKQSVAPKTKQSEKVDKQANAREQADKMKQELKDNEMGVKGQDAKEAEPSDGGTKNKSSWNPSRELSITDDKPPTKGEGMSPDL